MDTGHYKSYCKVRDDWFLFDDSVVSRVEEEDVLGSGIYMLFYQRKHLDFVIDA